MKDTTTITLIKNIAIICALPPGRNTGMATVDMAAYSLIKKLAPDAQITLYAYGRVSIYGYQSGELPFEYKSIQDNSSDFLNSDVFLYWGDFLHSRSYWEHDRGNIDGGRTENEMKLQMDDYAKYMFLSTLSEQKLENTIVFGSTIITNEATDNCDDFYNRNFTRFFTHAGAVYFRDALSASKISPLRNNEPTLACDCAFLLQDANLQDFSGFTIAPHREKIGVFFGRSPSKIKMLFFSKLLVSKLGRNAIWIPWFPTLISARLLARIFGYKIQRGHTSTGMILSSLSECKFVVTDTYHLCVNAWRMGIPAICIGRGAEPSTNSLSDKKKEILYEMYGARKFYVFLESLSFGKLRASVKHAVDALSNKLLSDQVSANIEHHKMMSYSRLEEALARYTAPTKLDADTATHIMPASTNSK